MQRGISQTPNLELAAGEPGFSGEKGHGRPLQISAPTLRLSLKADGGLCP